MRVLVINCSPVRNGATARIMSIATQSLSERHEVRCVCIDDFDIGLCEGCRACHTTARCVQQDDVDALIAQYEWAEVIISVSPSYWADVPGQFKVFIDRCTPWCNTHQPHASLSAGKRAYSIVLRTGPGEKECLRIVETLEHFNGHMEIESCGSLCLCAVSCPEEAEQRREEITAFCEKI